MTHKDAPKALLSVEAVLDLADSGKWRFRKRAAEVNSVKTLCIVSRRVWHNPVTRFAALIKLRRRCEEPIHFEKCFVSLLSTARGREKTKSVLVCHALHFALCMIPLAPLGIEMGSPR
jgi:hypothetical protein